MCSKVELCLFILLDIGKWGKQAALKLTDKRMLDFPIDAEEERLVTGLNNLYLRHCPSHFIDIVRNAEQLSLKCMQAFITYRHKCETQDYYWTRIQQQMKKTTDIVMRLVVHEDTKDILYIDGHTSIRLHDEHCAALNNLYFQKSIIPVSTQIAKLVKVFFKVKLKLQIQESINQEKRFLQKVKEHDTTIAKELSRMTKEEIEKIANLRFSKQHKIMRFVEDNEQKRKKRHSK